MLIEIRSVAPIIEISGTPLLLLKKTQEDAECFLMEVPLFTVFRIGIILGKPKSMQPITDELYRQVFGKTGLKVKRAIITKFVYMSESHTFVYFAIIQITKGSETFSFDCSATDAIAIALSAEAPIFMEQNLFEEYKSVVKDPADDEPGGSLGAQVPRAPKQLPKKADSGKRTADEEQLEKWRKILFDPPALVPKTDKP